MTLRPYQTDLITATREALRSGAKSPLVQLSTGGGKTVIFATMCAAMSARGQLCWVLIHRKELVTQTHAKLTQYGCRESIEVHMITTVSKRLASITTWPRWVIVDEAHHAASATWAKVISACQANSATVIGYSATPERLDGRGLGMFDRLLCGPTTRELQAGGYLAKTKYFCPPSCAVTDWREAAVEAAARAQKVTGDAIASWMRHALGLPTIVFCTSLEHCAEVLEEATLAGITAAAIDGSMSEAERKQRIAALADGTISWLVSCELISEGLDVPCCKCVILLRPTQSLALHLQQIGRPLRPWEDKIAIILDHVGNCMRLGFAETEREWSLEGKTKSRGTKPVLRRCERCYAAWEGVKLVCPNCGHTNAPAKNKRVKNEDGELVETEPLEKMPMPPKTLKLMRGMFARRMLFANFLKISMGGTTSIVTVDWPIALNREAAARHVPAGAKLLAITSRPVPRAEFGRMKRCARAVSLSSSNA